MLIDFGMEPALGWTPTKGSTRVDEIHHWLEEFEEKTTEKVASIFGILILILKGNYCYSVGCFGR
jgi:hypothetical protein